VGKRSEEYFRTYGARLIVRSPHFVDNEFFAARAETSRRANETLRARFGIPDTALLCLFAGKLQAKKRPLDVLRAARLARRDVDVRVVFVGDGELRAACEAEAHRLAVPSYFAGFLNQSEIPRAYAGADVLVLPSDGRETWGLVVNEAMACGVPALVSRAAGCQPDLVVEGETGFSFDVGDVAALGGHLVALGRDRAERHRLARGAGRHVAHYSVDAAAAGVLEAVRLVARA
jgi:glycosyltransferase involved in cell wall biosynthesis